MLTKFIRYRFSFNSIQFLVAKYFRNQIYKQQNALKNYVGILAKSKIEQNILDELLQNIQNYHKQTIQLSNLKQKIKQDPVLISHKQQIKQITNQIFNKCSNINKQRFSYFLKNTLKQLNKAQTLSQGEINLLKKPQITYQLVEIYINSLTSIDFLKWIENDKQKVKNLIKQQLQAQNRNNSELFKLLGVIRKFQKLKIFQDNIEQFIFRISKKIYLHFNIKEVKNIVERVQFINLYSKSNFNFKQLRKQIINLLSTFMKRRDPSDWKFIIKLIRNGLSFNIQQTNQYLQMCIPLILLKVNQQPSLMVGLAMSFMRKNIIFRQFWDFYFDNIELFLKPQQSYYIYVIDKFFDYWKNQIPQILLNKYHQIKKNQKYINFLMEYGKSQVFKTNYIKKYGDFKFKRPYLDYIQKFLKQKQIQYQRNVFHGISFLDFYFTDLNLAVFIYEQQNYIKNIDDKNHNLSSIFQRQLQFLELQGIKPQIIEKDQVQIMNQKILYLIQNRKMISMQQNKS